MDGRVSHALRSSRPPGRPGRQKDETSLHTSQIRQSVTGEWDSYQCKHYDHALHPSDVYAELGKLCFYTHDGSSSTPRQYRFVAPFGVGVTLYDLLRKPGRLQSELIANWDTYCLKKISSRKDVPLEGALKTHVDAFDFSIVWFITPAEVLTQHKRTSHWFRRFKIDGPVRPQVGLPPEEVQPTELRYVQCLLDAYGDHMKRRFDTPVSLSSEPRFANHFKRARQSFFSADALGRFSRDHFDDNVFEKVKDHLYDGVVDVSEAEHATGFECVQKVMELAVAVTLPASELKDYLEPADKKGLCHHLANDGRLTWCSDAGK